MPRGTGGVQPRVNCWILHSIPLHPTIGGVHTALFTASPTFSSWINTTLPTVYQPNVQASVVSNATSAACTLPLLVLLMRCLFLVPACFFPPNICDRTCDRRPPGRPILPAVKSGPEPGVRVGASAATTSWGTHTRLTFGLACHLLVRLLFRYLFCHYLAHIPVAFPDDRE